MPNSENGKLFYNGFVQATPQDVEWLFNPQTPQVSYVGKKFAIQFIVAQFLITQIFVACLMPLNNCPFQFTAESQ